LLDEIHHRVETLGELLHIRERLVVAPAWGRLRAGELDPGDLVEDGDVIGAIHEAGEDTPLVCHTSGHFVGWTVVAGKRVAPGMKLAVLRLLD
jgi:YD repeat-containing protein